MSIQTKYFHLRTHPLFISLEEKNLMLIAAFAKTNNFYRGAAINYTDGSYSKIYFVVKGKIKVAEVNELGDELVIDILAPGDMLGNLSLNGNQQTNEYAEALTKDTLVYSFDVADFKKILQANPLLALQYANEVNSKLQKAQSRHADLVFRDVKWRLINFIKYWANIDGNKVGDKIVLTNYLTHRDIAGFISTSRQSVNILLNELRDAGLLFYNRKTIELNKLNHWN